MIRRHRGIVWHCDGGVIEFGPTVTLEQAARFMLAFLGGVSK